MTLDVDAHCDIPCGIYETGTADTAAKTVATLTKKILDLGSLPPADGNASKQLAYENTIARMVMVKEHHAQLCKEQLLILWTDYFKPNHLQAFPDLHETFWKAAKLCSYCKQNVDLAKAEELQKAVAGVSAMFEKAEAAKK